MENKLVSIHDDKNIKFPYVKNIKQLQEKFDLLFTTAILVGYKKSFEYRQNDQDTLYTIKLFYLDQKIRYSKLIMIQFLESIEGVKEIYMLATNQDLVNVELAKNEKLLLNELDKILLYI